MAIEVRDDEGPVLQLKFTFEYTQAIRPASVRCSVGRLAFTNSHQVALS